MRPSFRATLLPCVGSNLSACSNLYLVEFSCNRIYICYILLSNCVHVFSLQTAFTSKKDYGREEREAHWASAHRSANGLQPAVSKLFNENTSYRELSEIAEQARKRAEVAR